MQTENIVCGNYICEEGEDTITCPQDCKPVCYLTPPLNLTAALTNETTKEVTLNFTHADFNGVGYFNIYRSNNSMVYSYDNFIGAAAKPAGAHAATYTDASFGEANGLTDGIDYFYVATSYPPNGTYCNESDYSEEAAIRLCSKNKDCRDKTKCDDGVCSCKKHISDCHDKDKDGIIEDPLVGDKNSVKTNVKNLKIILNKSEDLAGNITGEQELEFSQEDKPIITFKFNFSEETLDLNNVRIMKQDNTSRKGFIIIKGIALKNRTKTAYVDRLTNKTTLCVKDAEITDISEISSSCNGANELIVDCSRTNNYNCTIINNTYQLQNLRYSGIIELEFYCGDNICRDESCGTCQQDCGICPVPRDEGRRRPREIAGGSGSAPPSEPADNKTSIVAGDIIPLEKGEEEIAPQIPPQEPQLPETNKQEKPEPKQKTRLTDYLIPIAVLFVSLALIASFIAAEIRRKKLGPEYRLIKPLEKYVKKQRNSGFSDKEIKKAIIKAGWPKKYVDRAFKQKK